MTDGRKNEVWALLPDDFKEEVFAWVGAIREDNDEDTIIIFNSLFGKNNLTTKFDETTPKSPSEPKYKVGDKVLIKNYGKFYDRIGRITHIHGNSLDVEIPDITEVEMFFIEDVVPYNPVEQKTEPNGESNGESDSNCPNPTENGISDKNNSPETADSVKTIVKQSDLCQSSTDWDKYRLELAKEIALAVIRSDRWDFHNCDPVNVANDIVKRLKETEE